MTAAAEDRVRLFEQLRPRLFSIAYRMMGSRADAEDVLQEGWLRWHAAAHTEIQSPGAWLSTVVTRLCLDQLKSVEVRRKEYIGPWLPEPMARTQELADSVSYAFFVLLQTLSPPERCALLLRDVLGYEFAEIAPILDASEANCRKLLERARKQVAARRTRQRIDEERHRELLHRFARACGSGDPSALIDLLASDARLRSDGGGKVRAALNPILGADRVARFFIGIMPKIPPGLRVEFSTRYGEPAMESHCDGRLFSVLFIAPEPERDAIGEIFLVSNPDKLGEAE